ncbi:hypothetical protein HELRODRAFT_178810 [Helobdella robusta]|uniref:Uncharacterized protein n=1 Tax=Helobdella robusta TaxID=6412 RepID=T1FDR9_HELRO|nr:hypothetical protein HELRODRAFT_178810 [Helobdella robusta]ESN95895.1 hypothetical protein HELRODRAFT_178810 [Helobdella robusta]
MGASLFKCCQPSTFEEVELNKPEPEEDPQSRDLIILKNMISKDTHTHTTINKNATHIHASLYTDTIPSYVPGKMIDNVLYCVGTGKEAEEEEPDGCVILKTKSRLLIACYRGDSEVPIRTAESSAHQMIDRNL